MRRHLFDHLLWSIFQSSLHILNIINHAGPPLSIHDCTIDTSFLWDMGTPHDEILVFYNNDILTFYTNGGRLENLNNGHSGPHFNVTNP